MTLLHKSLEEKIKKAERLPKSTPADLSNIYTKDEVDAIIDGLPEPGVFSGDMDDISDGANYVKTENNYTDTEKSKLTNIENNATKYPDTGEEVFTTAEKSKVGISVISNDISAMVKLTQAEYDLIGSPNPATLYIVVG